MAQGKWKSFLLGIQGLVGHAQAPDWGFIYEASLVRNPKFNIGDRVVLPDGREFRYAKASAACISGQGCEFTAVGKANIYPITTYAAGSTKITGANNGSTTVLTHAAAFAKDVFRGGYVVCHDVAGGNADDQFRGIVGNDYSAINAVLTLYLDGPLHKAAITNTFTEVFENPYAALRTGTTPNLAKAGVPAVEVSTALMYFWVQKIGPCFVAPQAAVIDNQIGCYWRADGSLQDAVTAFATSASDANISMQYAGFTMSGNYAGFGPMFYLQG